jgi:hypothetical protein
MLTTALLLWVVQAVAATPALPSTLEIDLVFPRNETYAPAAMFPIVFALQNASLFPLLHAYFNPGIMAMFTRESDIVDSLWGISLKKNLVPTNTSDAREFYIYTYSTELNKAPGNGSASYYLYWFLGMENCSITNDWPSQHVYFSIQHGAQKPNLSTAGSTVPCEILPHMSIAVNSSIADCSIPSAPDALSLDRGTPCSATQIDEQTAANISASMEAEECRQISPVISCPAKSKAAAPVRLDKADLAVLAGGLVMAFRVACLL